MAKLDYRSSSSASASGRATGGEATLAAFVVPLALLVIGLLLFGVVEFRSAGARSVLPIMGVIFVVALIEAALGIVAAYVTASLLGTGFGELRSAFVKLAGIIIFCGALGALIPFGGIVVFFVYFGLLIWLFQLEVYEAVVFSVVLWVTRLVVRLAAAGMIAGALG
jgi:hypothetical protein